MTTSQPTGLSTVCTASATNINSPSIQSNTSNAATSLLPVTTSVGTAITTFAGSNSVLLSSLQTVPISSATGHQTATTSATTLTSATQTATTSQIDITPEETNFLRLTSLVLKIGPSAVRRLFDMFNDPDGLNKKIKDNETKLKELLSKGIITKDHWDILFPANKHASSKNFDITLMIAFLREISGMKAPKSGWNTRPSPNDYSTGADLARIKYYRNKVAHAASCSLDKFAFSSIWNELSEAIIRIGGDCFRSETTAMLTSSLDASYQDLYRELKAMKGDIIPQNIQFLMDVHIEEMVKDDKTFVHTNATKSVRESINQSDVIMVTGPPGSGKTFTVNHIALQLQEDGYKICPVVSTKEIIDYWMPEVPQVFILNDPFGIHDINQSELHQWMNHQDRLEICMKYSSMKIIATLRTHIIEDKQIAENALSSSNLQIVSLINGDNALTKEERLEIFNAHVKFQNRNDLKDMGVEIQNFTIPCFPLLCKIYTSDRQSKFSDKDFFQSPLSLISKDLYKFKTSDPVRYFCLLYCMINDNYLDNDMLSVNKKEKSDVKENREILLEKCELASSLSREKIKSKMNTLLNTYLKQEGNRYQFIHDIIHDAVIGHVNSLSSDFKQIVLNTCASKFLNERIRLSSIVYSHKEDAYLILNSDLESIWGARILQDMKDGHWNDLVKNTTLHDEKGDVLLAKSLKSLDQVDFQNIMISPYPREVVLPTLQAIQEDFIFYIEQYLDNVTILHLIVCLELKHCLEVVLKSIPVLTLHQLKLNLLLLACITGKTNIVKVLLANKWSSRYNITMTNNSLVLISSYYGHYDIVKLFIEYNADVNQCNKYGESPLYVSSNCGHCEVVELLLSHEVDINQCDNDGKSPLYVSSKRGHYEVVKLLLSHEANINQCDNDGKSPLYVSSKRGHYEVVKLLLSHEANINQCDNAGMSPLYVSSECGHYEVVKLLISHEANINQHDMFGGSPLYVSSKRGHYEVVKLLLSHEANINQCDNVGMSPLYVSSVGGHHDVVKLLLSHEANINQCNNVGMSPLYVSSVGGHHDVVKLLLSHEANINQCNNVGMSPLYVSSNCGHYEVVKLLLSHEANINQCNNDGRSPLYVSSMFGHYEVVKLLLSHEANINQCDNDGISPLYVSSKRGHYEVVKLLISHEANINQCDNTGRSPLYVSSERGHYEVVELLISHEANINQCDNAGMSPLYVSSKRGHYEVVKLLISHEANINQHDMFGGSPLYVSSKRGHYEVVKLLLSHEANINQCDKAGMSPLYVSTVGGHHDVVKLLLSHEANINQCNVFGMSPLYVSSGNGHYEVVKLLLGHEANINRCDVFGISPLYVSSMFGHYEVVKLLISHEANINQCDNDGMSPLCVSSEHGHYEVVKLLLGHEANINQCDNNGRSPLYVSSKRGHYDVVKLLISHEANINQCDVFGISPLYVSSECGHYEVVKLLISHEANINQCDNDGRSPLYVSSENGHYEVVKLLLSHEANINQCDNNGRSPLHVSSERRRHDVVKLLLSHKTEIN